MPAESSHCALDLVSGKFYFKVSQAPFSDHHVSNIVLMLAGLFCSR